MPRGVGIHLHEQADIIQRGWNNSGDGDVGVADIEELRDHEGGRAHHGRCQHGAGRGAGFDRAGIGGAEAAFFHHGNGHGAGGQHVGNDRAGHHAEQAAGENADLGGAAAKRAAQRERKIDEELAGAGHHQRGAEHQKADHGVGERLNGNAEQALARQYVIGRGLLERELRSPEWAEP